MKNTAILLASGVGSRLGGDIPKQFIELNDCFLFEYSLQTFNRHISIDEIVFVCHPDYIDFVKNIIKRKAYTKVSRVVPGGNTRQESVSNGIFSISNEEGNVLIHDTARPFVTNRAISEVIEELKIYNAVSTVLPAKDTIFMLDNNMCAASIPNRSSLACVQTPQGFDLSLIKKAHYLALKQNINTATDDCSLIMNFNLGIIKTVIGDDICFKVTTLEDLQFAKSIINNSAGFNSN